MDIAKLFAQHGQHVQSIYEEALEKLADAGIGIDAVLIHSGSEGVYFQDDQHLPFIPYGHFTWWVPVRRPEQMILVQPGKKPTFFQVVPPDFWYDQTVDMEPWWADCFEIIRLENHRQVMDHLPGSRRIAFLGENTQFAGDMGLPTYLWNEVSLKNYLDYHRGMKTAYEVERLKEANRMAVHGHSEAFEAFCNFGSEWEIHQAFLIANHMIEHDSPYTNIVGLDEKAAILHYQHKRRTHGKDSKVLLIDAGCRSHGYCSDITRTYARDDAHPVFKELVKKVDQLQLNLVDHVKVGSPYKDLHEAAHEGVVDILLELGIVSGAKQELIDKQISHLFFPHGIGHLLGIQVHDVGGYFKDESGVLAPPPEEHRFLRLNRPMTKGMVFTIEPGIYFIPVLLDPERNSKKSGLINWSLVDALTPLGGVRIEDNIFIGDNGPENLTR